MPRGTQDLWLMLPAFAYRTLTVSGATSQTLRLAFHTVLPGPTTPPYKYDGLGSSAFARHYSRNCLFSSGY